MDIPIYGLEAERSAAVGRGAIGRVEKSHTGNVILRVGRGIAPLGWDQVAYVVMVPEEARDLARSILAAADADGWNSNG